MTLEEYELIEKLKRLPGNEIKGTKSKGTISGMLRIPMEVRNECNT